MEAITDIAFYDGHVIIDGLSNQEFASSLRTIGFPFNDVENGAMIEIYHGAQAVVVRQIEGGDWQLESLQLP